MVLRAVDCAPDRSGRSKIKDPTCQGPIRRVPPWCRGRKAPAWEFPVLDTTTSILRMGSLPPTWYVYVDISFFINDIIIYVFYPVIPGGSASSGILQRDINQKWSSRLPERTRQFHFHHLAISSPNRTCP